MPTRPARRASTLLVTVLAAGAMAWGAEPPLAGPPAPAGLPRVAPQAAPTPGAPLPYYLADRGEGVATSMFGTYVRGGETLVYPFFEYYKDDDFEYKPEELGYPGDQDHLGRYRASEGLIWVAHGFTEDLALELEAAVISASLDKAADDPSSVPSRIEESGLGDVEGQLRWRFQRETERRPELFSYFEFVIPHSKDKVLIGTPGWELALGGGIAKGFGWGTLTARLAVSYEEASSSHFDLGEYAIEYLKRLSPAFRIYLGLEGSQDELELITELQWHFSRHAYLKVNNGLGLTPKATDWAPEVGVVFRF
jgi:hypothetical protein